MVERPNKAVQQPGCRRVAVAAKRLAAPGSLASNKLKFGGASRRHCARAAASQGVLGRRCLSHCLHPLWASFSMFCTMQYRWHCALTFSRPRRFSRVSHWLCRTLPNSGPRPRFRDLHQTTIAMRVAAATKAASVRQRELPGRSCGANFPEMSSVLATDHVVRACPNASSDRGKRDPTIFGGPQSARAGGMIRFNCLHWV